MKLEAALKIWRETGRKIRPIGFDSFRDPHVEFIGYYLNSDYEVEPEPKKTVVMYKWAVIYDNRAIKEGPMFFENENQAKEYFMQKLVKRLDYTATEFEV